MKGDVDNNQWKLLDLDGQSIFFHAVDHKEYLKEYHDFLKSIFGKGVNVNISRGTGALTITKNKDAKLSADVEALYTLLEGLAGEKTEYEFNLTKDDQTVAGDSYYDQTVDMADMKKGGAAMDQVLETFHFFTEQKYKVKNNHQKVVNHGGEEPEYYMDHHATRADEKSILGRTKANVRVKDTGQPGFDLFRFDIVDATGKPIRTVRWGFYLGNIGTFYTKVLDPNDPAVKASEKDFKPGKD